jgi:hypothetical protein
VRKPPVLEGCGPGAHFLWHRDDFRSSLERQFQTNRINGCETLAGRIDAVRFIGNGKQLDALTEKASPWPMRNSDALETNLLVSGANWWPRARPQLPQNLQALHDDA